jgi:hypothetical protein
MTYPAINRDWYRVPGNLSWLVDYLAEVGWTGREIAALVRNPGAYSSEYARARTGAVTTETEPGL